MLIVLLTACGIAPSAPAPLPITSTPITTPPATLRATSAPTRALSLAPPAWLPRDLEMPKSAEFSGDSTRAQWSTRDLNADGLRDFFAAQAQTAGYARYIISRSAGAIYDLLLVKGAHAYALNLTRGLQTTVITLARVGMLHLKVSGAVNLETALPLRERIDSRAGNEIFIGTDLPNAQCARCQYFVFLHLAPFNGAGTYATKPAGVALIDAWIIPGGDPAKDDYRYAQECVVVIKDAASGSFNCKGLVNIRDDFKRVDISGTWQPPE